MPMPHNQSGDFRIAFSESGLSSAKPLLFFHGWTSDRTTFRHQVDYFSKTHRCISIDLPGHGDSAPEKQGDYSIASYLNHVQRFIMAQKLENAALIGHSFGAILALELISTTTNTHPCAILIDPAPMIQSEPLRASLLRTRQMLQTLGREATQAVLTDKVFFRKTDPHWLAEEIRSIARRTDDQAALNTWDTILAYDGRPALKRLKKPVCFINSDRPQNREDDIRAHASKVFWGRTVGTGHFNHVVMPRQVNAMVADFLDLTDLLST